ncbi:MAG: UDP-N-acetylmuramate--L-alanine ligase [Eggerthellaceae bacterium]|nr:UDP-N-acetylmuramate--L-alanine ligase [Eggerthellaceae bacterium]
MSKPVSDNVYFIGIGGVGMSGIARVANDQGLHVEGSDLKSSRFTKPLEDAGIKVHIGHAAENIPDTDPTIVVSTAILDDNPELIEAKRRGLDIVRRAEMLAHLGRNLDTVAVAGTHGKTTTSSMMASTFDKMGLSPTFLIGGMVREYGANAHSGTGGYYVVEADESDKSFTHLSPAAVIVTNIEPDHLDHYENIQEIYDQFGQFISLVPEGAPVVVWAGDEKLVEVARANADNVITYGLDAGSDVQVVDVEREGLSQRFTLKLPDGREVKSSIRQNPGIHNVLNGAATLAMADALGEDVEAAALALSQFQGVRRRFDLVGREAGVDVVDDYAHHPTEIAATIKAARGLDYNKVHVIFQPHRYSRAKLFTEVLHDEFGSAFDEADTVTFMDVYPAGETPIPGVSGKTFLNVVLDHEGHPDATFVPRRLDVPSTVAALADDGDIVLTLGAGDVTEIGQLVLDELASGKTE